MEAILLLNKLSNKYLHSNLLTPTIRGRAHISVHQAQSTIQTRLYRGKSIELSNRFKLNGDRSSTNADEANTNQRIERKITGRRVKCTLVTAGTQHYFEPTLRRCISSQTTLANSLSPAPETNDVPWNSIVYRRRIMNELFQKNLFQPYRQTILNFITCKPTSWAAAAADPYPLQLHIPKEPRKEPPKISTKTTVRISTRTTKPPQNLVALQSDLTNPTTVEKRAKQNNGIRTMMMTMIIPGPSSTASATCPICRAWGGTERVGKLHNGEALLGDRRTNEERNTWAKGREVSVTWSFILMPPLADKGNRISVSFRWW